MAQQITTTLNRIDAAFIVRACNMHEELVKALETSIDSHFATWMAARAEVEGATTSKALFEKETDIIAARAVLAKAREA